MGYLQGLKGLPEGTKIDCVFIKKAKEIEVILNNNLAATTAGSNGAINIYKDGNGNIRCEAQRYCSLVEEKTFEVLPDAVKWVGMWLKKIQ